MADTNPKDFSTTASSNSTVGGISVAEGSQTAQLNDAIRAVLAVIKSADWGAGGISLDTIAESTADAGVTIDGLLIKDGALPNLTLGDTIPVGSMYAYAGTSAPTGWLLLNGDSIGSAASAADQASDDYEDLFTLFWDSMANSEAAVSGGRGASAAADWAANKTLTMPDARGRAVIGSGTGPSLTARTHGDTDGEETHTLTIDEMPDHNHGQGSQVILNNSGVGASANLSVGGGQRNQDAFVPQGGDSAHNNMQPWLAMNWIIKF